MTLAEAFKIAEQAKPEHRQPLDKLHGTAATAQFSAGAAALNRRLDAMGGTVADMQKQIDWARAGVALCADVMKINLTETMQ